MRCERCGCYNPDRARFCECCGQTFTNQGIDLKKMGIFAVAVVIVIAIAGNALGLFGHGFTGVYQTYDYFLVDEITFEKNGRFSAVSQISGYTETYQGRYKKTSDGAYTFTFTDGTADSGNPVLDYEASNIGDQYELSVKEIDESTLEVKVVSKMGYLAWEGTTVYFYKYSDSDI